jgi:hypothetical protein
MTALAAPESVDRRQRQTLCVRSVVVPNLGAFAGLSMKYTNARLSLGYRADFFFGAVDGGIDQHKSYNFGLMLRRTTFLQLFPAFHRCFMLEALANFFLPRV